MFKTIEGAADCDIRPVIRFLNARNVLPSEIRHQMCQVYGDNRTSNGMVIEMGSDLQRMTRERARRAAKWASIFGER